MLVRLKCTEFRYGDKKQRPVITFTSGLNAIVGHKGSSGSVGKSTFLMVVDFAFGGDDYINRLKETVHKYVPKHEVSFTFEFKGEQYNFMRPTIESESVYILDSRLVPKEPKPWTIQEFRNWIYAMYNLPSDNPLSREHISRFFRVYHRGNISEKRPLSFSGKDTADGIDTLLQLLGEASLSYERRELNKSSEKLRVYRKATTFNFIPDGITAEDVAENTKNIRAIKKQIDALVDREPAQLEALNIFYDNERKLTGLKTNLSFARQNRGRLESEISIIKHNMQVQKDEYFIDGFNDLLEFFPGVNLPLLTKIEEFHKKLSGMLADEFGDALANLNESLDIVNIEIGEIEGKITELGKKDRSAELFAQSYYALKSDMARLQNENDTFKLFLDLENAVKAQKARLESLELEKRETLDKSSQKITAEMKRLNELICGDKLSAPTLKLKTLKTYTFNTFQDSGTSSSYRGLAIFDLAVLSLTSLPSLAHDFVILSQIETAHREMLFEYYSKLENKQIFIALDEIDSYNSTTKEVLEKAVVMTLTGENDDVLYGNSWNTKEEQEAAQQLSLEDVWAIEQSEDNK